MFQWLYYWLDRLFAVMGAFLMCQFPQFYEQYLQRAMGHLEELNHQIELMRQSASLTGKTLEEYIKKFLANSDLDILHQGALMEKMTARAKEVSEGVIAMSQAEIWTRPFTFLAHVQSDIATSSLAHFQPGLTFNIEGLVYALIGIFLGYCIFHLIIALIAAFFRALARPFRRKPKADTTDHAAR